MKRTIASVSILIILLTACASPFWVGKDVQEQGVNVRTAPLNNDELVARLGKHSLSGVEEPRGVTVRFDDLSFAPGKAGLSHQDRKTFRNLAKVLKDPLVIDRPIAVEGHTDSIGKAVYNLDLSRRRAQAVAQELIFNQIRAARITVRGYGEKFPIQANTNPDGTDNPAARAQNRRVEVIIGTAEEIIPEREQKR